MTCYFFNIVSACTAVGLVKRSGPNEMVWKDAGLEAPIIEEMFGGGNPDRPVLTLPLGIVNPPICGFGGFKRKTSANIVYYGAKQGIQHR